MSWQCPACPLELSTRQQLVFHVNGRHVNKDWKAPFQCGRKGCYRLYPSFDTWSRHLRGVHDKGPSRAVYTDSCSKEIFEENADEERIEIAEQLMDFEPTDDESALQGIESIKAAGVRFVSEMRACSSVTTSACEKAVQGCNDISESVVAYLREEVRMFALLQ